MNEPVPLLFIRRHVVDRKIIIIIIIIIIINNNNNNNNTEELSQPNEKSDAKQDGIQHTETILGESLKKWKNKVMHGKYIRNIDRQLISEEDAFLWLSKGELNAETESKIVATQDQALQTKYYATKILNTETDSKCRLCQQFEETIDHIISACPILAKELYIR